MMSFAWTPALPISFMPCAASVAENCESAPSLTAMARNDSSSAPVEPVLALTADIAWSKSANRLTAAPSATAMPVPARAALSASFENASALFGEAAFVRSSTAALAFLKPATAPSTFARNSTETTLSAMVTSVRVAGCGVGTPEYDGVMTTLDVQVKRLCENLRSARSALQQALDERDALVADLREMADGW